MIGSKKEREEGRNQFSEILTESWRGNRKELSEQVAFLLLLYLRCMYVITKVNDSDDDDGLHLSL